MKIGGVHYRTIWPAEDGRTVKIIDQTRLPHRLEIEDLSTLEDVVEAINSMRVRGAPLVGAAAAYGLCLALAADPEDGALERALAALLETRPTAVNLCWALEEMLAVVRPLDPDRRSEAAWRHAAAICEDDVAACRRIGEHGLELLLRLASEHPGRPLQVLTHCNAGWLAAVDWGTALAPVYAACDAGLEVHVWVDETRPRNQGASLTAFELGAQGVPHTVIVDNAGGHLMQHDLVDLCLVGTDRTTATGDVANKIGTYLKALAAADNGVPFWVAVPRTSIDWRLRDGVREIPIEERSGDEVTRVRGRLEDGREAAVTITAPGSPTANYAFDVTPGRLVTGLITDRGLCEASEEGLLELFPERGRAVGDATAGRVS